MTLCLSWPPHITSFNHANSPHAKLLKLNPFLAQVLRRGSSSGSLRSKVLIYLTLTLIVPPKTNSTRNTNPFSELSLSLILPNIYTIIAVATLYIPNKSSQMIKLCPSLYENVVVAPDFCLCPLFETKCWFVCSAWL